MWAGADCELAQDRGLRAKWERFIFGRPIECTDLLDGLLRAFERLYGQAGAFGAKRTLEIRATRRTKSQWLELNADVATAFAVRYRGLPTLMGGAIRWDTSHLFEYEALLETATIKPMVNQIRLCPGETQDEVVDYCRANSILPEAYSPLGVGKIFEVPEMQALAKKYHKSIAQICVRWSLQRGYLPLPKSVTPQRIRENTEVFDFELEPADVQLIADLKGCVGYSHNPDTITW